MPSDTRVGCLGVIIGVLVVLGQHRVKTTFNPRDEIDRGRAMLTLVVLPAHGLP